MKSMIKDTAILFAITLIAGFILGFVYNVTKEPIAVAEEKAAKEAYAEVFADAADFEEMEVSMDASYEAEWESAGFAQVSIEKILEAKDSTGNGIGYVLSLVSHAGYGGDIAFTLGIANDGTVNGISILSISETAGLGMKAEEVLKPQYAEKGKQLYSNQAGGNFRESDRCHQWCNDYLQCGDNGGKWWTLLFPDKVRRCQL